MSAKVIYVFESWENPLKASDQIRAALRAKALRVTA